MTSKTCCAPARNANSDLTAPLQMGGSYLGDVAEIPGGTALVGTNTPLLKIDGEAPLHKTKVKPFALGTTPVTNAAFQQFIEATNYETEAEKFGWSFVFHAQVPKGVDTRQGSAGAQWWRRVDGATWALPAGPKGGAHQPDHPAVHVSWNDAQAYCTWVGGRLPREGEWEHAARGGLGAVTYPWGEGDPNDTDHFPCNIFQGRFPDVNTAQDGFAFTSPARSFGANGYGLYGMAGNVWDWCADEFRIKSLSKAGKAQAAAMRGYKVIKGGSFLCHASYCTRYRIAARTGNSPDSSTSHTGFRIAFSI